MQSVVPWSRTLDDNDLKSIISRFRGRRVIVVGDVMLDEYLHGDVRRISPESPVPIVETTGQSYAAGGAGNVARNAATLGADVRIVAVTGDDPAAAILASLLCDGLSEAGL